MLRVDHGDCFGLGSNCCDECIEKVIRRTTGEV